MRYHRRAKQIDSDKERNLLYRGQNLMGHEQNNGVVRPKGNSPTVVAKFDGSFLFDGKFSFGPTENNAVRAHHIDTGKWNGCFISTSRDYDVAQRFATHNNCEGVIYYIDDTLFDQYGIVAKEFPDPLYPNEQEVSIRAKDCGPLPPEVIVKVDRVSPLANDV